MKACQKAKSLWAFILALVLVFSMYACGESGNDSTSFESVNLPAGKMEGLVGVDLQNLSDASGSFSSLSSLQGTTAVSNALIKVKGTNLRGISGSDGKFEINGVPAGVHDLIYEYDRNGDGEYEYSEIIEGINMPADSGLHLGWLKMNKTGEISGTVTLEGASTGNLCVTVFVPGTSYTAITDDSGNYVISGVPEGEHKVAAVKDGYCFSSVDGVTVETGVRTQSVNMDLQSCSATGSLTGRAYLSDSDVHEGITAKLLNTPYATTTLSEGEWSFSGVPVGVYRIKFSKYGYNPIIVDNVMVSDMIGAYMVNDVYLTPADSPDFDGDGTDDDKDNDNDNDGVADENDDFPQNPYETVDTDNDGIGDNADPDDDGDGFPDIEEIFAGSDSKNSQSLPGFIVYVAGAEKNEIWRMNPDGSNQEKLITMTGYKIINPRVSPDGTQIGFFKKEAEFSTNNGVMLMNLDGSSAYEVIDTGSDGSGNFWGFSPSGENLLFMRDVSSGSSQNYELFVSNIDGTSQVNLSNEGDNTVSANFSPDGSKIVYGVGAPYCSACSDLWIMNADGSNQQFLIDTNGGSDGNPRYSPHGTKILYRAEKNDLYQIDSYGNNPTNLTRSSASEAKGSWSPAGSHIVYSREGEIWAMKSDGTNQVPINNSGNVGNPHWGVDKQ
ncbi:MAG: carboxypeptidase regulatory-like domain-containing protein [bacterium]